MAKACKALALNCDIIPSMTTSVNNFVFVVVSLLCIFAVVKVWKAYKLKFSSLAVGLYLWKPGEAAHKTRIGVIYIYLISTAWLVLLFIRLST